MTETGFIRVTRNSRCPVCGSPRWCSTTADGCLCICMRQAEGAKKVSRNGGYVHVIRSDGSYRGHHDGRGRPMVRRVIVQATQARRADLEELVVRCRQAADNAAVKVLADSLGLTAESLRRLSIGWGSFEMKFGPVRAWSFPMKDVAGNVLGIRLRKPDGTKLAVLGGHEGLFIPADLTLTMPLLIAEGPTDTAALLDLGFEAIGRPCCSGGVGLLVDLVRSRRVKDVVIVSDADSNGAGQRGADSLAVALTPYCPSIRVIVPPGGIKDVRDWKRAGAGRDDIMAAVEATRARRLVVHSKRIQTDRKRVQHG